MKNLLIVLFLLIAVRSFSQSPAQDFFKPYKYPKRYTFDGAFNITELNTFLKAGTAGYGAEFKADLTGFNLGTPALRLNLGIGLAYNSFRTQEILAPTPLMNGYGENSVTDDHQVMNIQLYPRLWIRVLNPLNISIAGGPVGYVDENSTTGRFSVHDFVGGTGGEHIIDPVSKTSSFGAGYFYEAKAMINFKNWGISAGLSTVNVNKQTSLQPVAGLWFGASKFKRVVN